MKAELVEVKLPDHSDVSVSYSCMNTKHITISKKWRNLGDEAQVEKAKG